MSKRQRGFEVSSIKTVAPVNYVRSVTLDDITVKTLRDFGNGNLSAGIRRAAGIVDAINSRR